MSKFIVFSYVPLLRGKAGDLIEMSAENPASQLPPSLAQAAQSGAGYVDGCAWRNIGVEMSPVLLIKNMRAIADHLIEWAEDEPQRWFHLYIYEARNRYAVALVPNIEASVERFRLAMKMLQGIDVSEQEMQLMFQPLVFVSGPNPATFLSIKSRIGESAIVGMADVDDMHEVRELARFPVRRDSCFGLLDKALAEAD